MKKIIIYEALDGERFETKEECEFHEASIVAARTFLSAICPYDSDNYPIPMPGAYEENFDEKFEEALSKMSRLVIFEDLPKVAIDYAYDYMSIHLPNAKGTYRHTNNKWLSFEEELKAFYKDWGIKIS